MPGRQGMRGVRARLVRWSAVARARIRLALELLAARIDAQVARLNVRLHGAALGRERARCLRTLGEAVHESREDDVARVKGRLAQVEAGLTAVRAELGRIDEVKLERIRLARREDGSTAVAEQVPTTVPEPSPAPSGPPGPVVVPEPQPAPHEPPGPVIVPEPGPPVEPEPGPPAAI